MAVTTEATNVIDLRDGAADWPLPDRATIDRRITEYDAQIGLIRSELDAIAGAYRAVTKTWLADWYEEEARRAITADPAFTASVPDEQLATMRSEIIDVVADAPTAVDELLADQLWPHHADHATILAEPRDCSRLPEAIDLGHRRLMGRLGGILASFGFGRASDVAVAARLTSYDWAVVAGEVEYPFAITISDEAKALFGEYCKVWGLLHTTVAEAATFELARRRSAVIDRWEQLG